MAVKIRLKRLGKIRSPHYRIVVMDARAKRDGRAIEEIGIYHPKNEPSVIEVKSERAQYWLGVGAQPTEAVVALFKRTGDWQKFTGETAEVTSAVEAQKTKPDKVARFNEALAEADNEPSTTAISKSRRQQAAEEAEAATAEAAAAEPAPSAEDAAPADEA
ncbi:MAG: 30S ribosomal protein S16 [Micrococcales bacterium]|nr:30S ribosomal protein S16 [Micrococcales bacterium]